MKITDKLLGSLNPVSVFSYNIIGDTTLDKEKWRITLELFAIKGCPN